MYWVNSSNFRACDAVMLYEFHTVKKKENKKTKSNKPTATSTNVPSIVDSDAKQNLLTTQQKLVSREVHL